MFGSRRLAKRSIVGTRVAALWQDGRYYPGVIQAQTSDAEAGGPAAESVYTVRFDDGHLRDVASIDIVGPGFQTVTASKLKEGQKVFITLNGRETAGLVTEQAFDEVIISVKAATGELAHVGRRPDEVRLMESRKSARLQDQDTDYSLMADLQITEPKKRTVSHVIDVPSAKPTERSTMRVRQDMEEEMKDTVGDLSSFSAERAAQVLSTMNDNPTASSPGWQTRGLEIGRLAGGELGLSSSVASSGFGSGQSEGGGPSPPLNPLLTTPMDDGIDLEENVRNFYQDSSPRHQEDEPSASTAYKCLWKDEKTGACCHRVFRTEEEAIAHLSDCHFQGQEVPPGEEDFYIEDVELEVEGVVTSFAHLSTASSPPTAFSFPVGGLSLPSAFDHDYQRKERSQPPVLMASSVPAGSSWPVSPSCPIPISLSDVSRSLSWQPASSPSTPQHPLGLSPLRSSPSMQDRLQQHQALSPKSHMLSSPPKSLLASRKPRSEGSAKCRKVFGTDKRQQWCTQCKWKKACTRFT